MKLISLFVFFLLLSLHSFGQKNCELKFLDPESKAGLTRFWEKFREAIIKKDTVKLLSICEFPFTISTDILTNKIKDKGESLKLGANDIMQYASLIFFEKNFDSSLSACNDPIECLILHGNWNKKHKTCVYEFFYLYHNKDGSSQERNFSITLIDTSYKITTNWIRY